MERLELERLEIAIFWNEVTNLQARGSSLRRETPKLRSMREILTGGVLWRSLRAFLL